MSRGHFLGPHIDNFHDGHRLQYFLLNLLYYAAPDWLLEFGSNLEVWDYSVKRHDIVMSKFNRLVIMEINPTSWQSVSEVKVDACDAVC